MANAHAKPSHVFRVLRQKKKGRAKACLKRVFAIVVQRSQLVLFSTVSENYGFLSQNAASEASNQYVHISISKGRKGCRS